MLIGKVCERGRNELLPVEFGACKCCSGEKGLVGKKGEWGRIGDKE